MSLLCTVIHKRQQFSQQEGKLRTIQPLTLEVSPEITDANSLSPGLILIDVLHNDAAYYFRVAAATLKYHIQAEVIDLELCLYETINQCNKEYF